MKKTERINLSVRPEFKEAVKTLFSGESLSNSYEKLVNVYLRTSILDNERMLEENIEALKIYREAGSGLDSVEKSIITNIESLEKIIAKHKNIMEKAFPNHAIEEDVAEFNFE